MHFFLILPALRWFWDSVPPAEKEGKLWTYISSVRSWLRGQWPYPGHQSSPALLLTGHRICFLPARNVGECSGKGCAGTRGTSQGGTRGTSLGAQEAHLEEARAQQGWCSGPERLSGEYNNGSVPVRSKELLIWIRDYDIKCGFYSPVRDRRSWICLQIVFCSERIRGLGIEFVLVDSMSLVYNILIYCYDFCYMM